MSWFFVVINFIILMGISLYFANIKNITISDTFGKLTLGFSTFTIILSTEMLLFCYWLGSVFAIEIFILSVLLALPISIFFQKKNSLLSLGKVLTGNDNQLINRIYFMIYFLIKFLLILMSSYYLLRVVVGWQDISTLVAVSMMVAAYTLFGNFKSLVSTQAFQILIIILASMGLFFFNGTGNQGLVLETHVLNIANWKLLIVGVIFGFWVWNFEYPVCQRRELNENRMGSFLVPSLFLILLLLILQISNLDTVSNNVISKIIIITIVMYSLANGFNSVADLLKNDIIRYLQPKESQGSGELIRKIIITGLTILNLLIILVMKNVTISDIIYIWGFWLNFIVISVALAIFTQFVDVKIYTILFSYFVGLIIPVIPEIFKLSLNIMPFTIVDNALLGIAATMLIVSVFSILSMVTSLSENSNNEEL